MMKQWFVLLGLIGGLSAPMSLLGAGAGNQVVVIYNRRVPESKDLANYYAQKRQVPLQQVLGFDLPRAESITRTEFRDQLQQPLLKSLERKKLWVFATSIQPATEGKPGQVVYRPAEARIRYAVLCYGVPLRILRDTNEVEKGEAEVRVELRRNEAAVDNELAVLPLSKTGHHLFGPLMNPLYGTTNTATLQPANGLLMVARLDGPSVAIARGLVDKAIQAETDGLWGRAYFDARGLTNGSYQLGDHWIRGAATICRRLGFSTVLDDRPATFNTAFPMSQIAFYAGWYDANVSGPFTLPEVEFMPGAFAYHLHSYSAPSIRTPNQHWVGPLLDKGVTATMGCVDEPYLEGTPDIAVFFARFLRGFTFGEAAYASQRTLSWQTAVVGDPLYCPYGLPPQQLHAALERHHNRLIEWSHLRIVNLNEVTGLPMPELIDYLVRLPDTRQSAVLQEKLGDLYRSQDKRPEAIPAYETALKCDPTPQQRIRLAMELGPLLAQNGQEKAAYQLWLNFIKEFPHYPDLLGIYRNLLPLAQKTGQIAAAEQCQREIERLSAAARP